MLGVETFAVVTGPTSPATVIVDPTNAYGMAALAYHALRDAMEATLALDAGARTFIDGPNIVSLRVDIGTGAEARTVHVGLDIWRRDHGILPLAGASATVPEAELVAGVTDHVAERFAVEGLTSASGVGSSSIGVGEVFEAATAQEIPALVLQGSIPDALPYGPMARELIEEAVASGDVVVVPAQPVLVGDTERLGWWRIDPTTGVTTDVMDDGSGAAVVEYATLNTGRRQQFVCFGSMANWAAGSIIAAAELVSTLSGSAIFRLFNAGWGGTRCFGL
jgi:hypothetical protein